MKNKKLILTVAIATILLASDSTFAAPKTKSTTKQISVKIETSVGSSNSLDKLIEYGNYVSANTQISAILKKNPTNLNAKVLRTVLWAKEKKLNAAQKEVDILMKKYPQNADLHYAQGLINFARLSSSNMDFQGNKKELIESAKDEFIAATILNKNHYAAYNALGVCELKLGNFDKARQMFEKSLTIDSNYAIALDNLGTIDYLNGNLNEAEKKFNKALSINSNNATAMFHLAQVAEKRADYTKAVYHLNNALSINSNSSHLYNLLGEVYSKQGNEAAAIASFKKASAITPENPQPYLNLAEIYEKRSDSAFALEQLKTAVGINPDDNEAKLKIADISFTTGDYNQALKYYSNLLGIEKYNEEALKGVANTYFEIAKISASKNMIGSTQNFYKALDNINKAIAANPEDLELYLAKIKLMNISNKPYEQKVLLNQLINLPIKSVSDMVTKGEAYFSLDDVRHAEEMFYLAVNSTKTLDEDLFLAEILTYHKHYEPAKKALQKALFKDANNETALSNFDYILKTENRSNALLKDAIHFYETDNNILAKEYAIRSLNYNPMNQNSILLVAQTMEKDKDYIGAIYNYEKYLNYKMSPRQAKKINKKINRLEKKIK